VDRGKLSHATDPEKKAGSSFIKKKNRDSIPTVDRGKLSHATDPGKKAGSHFIEKKNRDSMPTVDRAWKAAKASHGTDPGKTAGSHFIEKKNRDSMPSVDRGKASHATDPGKTAGSHFFIETKNRDSMPSVDRARKGGKAGLGKPKSGSTECYVAEEVNPIDKKPLSEKGSRFASKKNAKDRLWKLIIVAEEPEDITAVDDEMYNDMSAQFRDQTKQMH